jgi:membrane fusion protein, multidrug efflux system
MKRATVVVIALAGVLLAGGAGLVAKRMRAPAAEPASAGNNTRPGAQGANGTVTPPDIIEIAVSDLGAAETREVRRELPLTGQMRPVHSAFVRAKVAGEVLELRAREGETVKAGQVLARIDPAEYQARLDERVAALAASRATWENNERTRKNNEELLRKNFISQQAYDNTLANSTVALAQVKAAEANVALAQKSLDDAVVRAPWTGLVAERSAQVGDKASVDMKLVTLVDLSRMEIEAGVPAGDIPSVSVGQEVAFRVEGFADRAFNGRIARIAPQAAAGSRSIMVYIDLPNSDGALKGGMFAKGLLTLSRSESVLAVPVTALREERGETVVYAVVDGKLERVAVKVGARNEGQAWAEVAGALKAGTQVIRTNLGALVPGVKVRMGGGATTATAAASPPTAAPPAAATAPPAAATKP